MPSILETPIYQDVREYYGDSGVPYSIQSLRLYTAETMQRVGTPVLLKRIYTIEDVENGVAEESPNFDDIYNQSTYAQDQLSYGVGFWSIQTQDGEWYDPTTGDLYINSVIPVNTYLPAARYRGYGPGFLTYAILPDRPEDVWKLNVQGALIRQQNAMGQLPWWPQVGDNDLLITCQLDGSGNIIETFERYQLKQVTPITMRGENAPPGLRSTQAVIATGLASRWRWSRYQPTM
jgi:hypothetical protein